MSIIGLAGKARSGKNVFADYLKESLNNKYNRTFELFAFADVLKNMCQREFELTHDQLWGNSKEIPDERYKKSDSEEFWSAREIMQAMGSFYRTINFDFWVKKLNDRVVNRKDIIITDVRYMNEANFIRKSNGILIKIVRDTGNNIHGKNHESEINLNNYKFFDLIVENKGTLEDLQKISVEVSDVFISLEKLAGRKKVI